MTGTTCKITAHEKEKHRQAEAGEETAVVVGRPHVAPVLPILLLDMWSPRHAGAFKLKKAFQDGPSRGDFPAPQLLLPCLSPLGKKSE